MVTLVADRGPKPFALPRRMRTEEGRAWARSVVANLRGQGAPRVFDLGDGVIHATIPCFDGILGTSGSLSIARSVPVSGCALP